MFKLILIILYIILPILVIFVERKNPTEAILWVIILLCLPYVGIILYLVFGSTFSIKLTSYIRNKKLKRRISITNNENIVKGLMLSESDKDVIKFNYKYNNSILTCYDNIEIFTNGKEHYKQLFNDIKNAKKCIFIEFYTIHNDIVGNELIKLLTEKVKSGVPTLIMIDFIANLSLPNKIFKNFKKYGGKIIRLKPFLTHYRSHRKIVTIDNNISYIGGMNIGKQYANMAIKKNPWRDTQVRMTGYATSILDEYFMNDWLCAINNKLFNETVNILCTKNYKQYNISKNVCQFIKGGVFNRLESIKMSYLSMIRTAKNKICIQTPYFIPDQSILDALKTALATGISVYIMIPGIKASFFLDPVTNYYCGELLKYGAKIYKYKGYIHAKTMIIDDEICCVGSVNMDNRSLLVDDEICGIFYSNNFVKKYLKIFNNDISNCNTYELYDFNNRTNKEKILECIFLPFAPLM